MMRQTKRTKGMGVSWKKAQTTRWTDCTCSSTGRTDDRAGTPQGKLCFARFLTNSCQTPWVDRSTGFIVPYCSFIKHKRWDGPTAHVHRWDALMTGQGRLVLQINSCQTIWGGQGHRVCCSKNSQPTTQHAERSRDDDRSGGQSATCESPETANSPGTLQREGSVSSARRGSRLPAFG